jgi:hypothetical protein
MLGHVQQFLGWLVVALDAAGVVYFFLWLRKTDWLFGHVRGPPSYILAALGLTSAGLVAGLLWLTFALYRRYGRAESRPWSWPRAVALTATFVLFVLPALLVLVIAIGELPLTLRDARR